MNNNIDYNIVFNIINDNKVITSVKEINTALVNIDKVAIKVDQAFINMINNIKENMKTIRFTSILKQTTRAISSLNVLGMGLPSSMHYSQIKGLSN